MKDFEEKMQVLREGQSDEMNLLEDAAMDSVMGGVKCKKGYDKHYCACGYEGPGLDDDDEDDADIDVDAEKEEDSPNN